MKRFSIVAIVISSVLLFLVYFSTRRLIPDPQMHQHFLTHLLRSFLADARLQREVLQAEVGVPVNYDVLNAQVATLRDSLSELRPATAISFGPNARRLEAALRGMLKAVENREDLVEQFKSASALMQNSDRVFTYVLGQFGNENSSGDTISSNSVLRSAVALTVFTHHPDKETEAAARSALEALVAQPVIQRDSDKLQTLLRHGTLLIELIPIVDVLTERIERADLYNSISLLRNRYLHAYAEREHLADQVRLFLLCSALSLAFYNVRLLYQLARSACQLERRLSLEQAAATISSHLLSLPWKKTPEGILFGLERLVRQMKSDKARMLIVDNNWRVEAAYSWPPASGLLTVGETKELIGRAALKDDLTGAVCRATGARVGPSQAVLQFSLGGVGNSTGYLVLTKDGKTARIEAADWVLLDLVGGIFRAALERLLQEGGRQKLQAQLARAQRLEALGTFASSVAHEFSNILGAIRGHAELADEKLTINEPTRYHIAQILTGSARAQVVIDSVLSYGRQRSRRRNSFDASAALSEALALLRGSLPETVRFRPEIQPGLILSGDLTEFQQIVLNLCRNAAHAIDGIGEIHVQFSTVEFDKNQSLSHSQLPPGPYARLVVDDTGPGIPPELMERIFEPFFTTKGSGAGSGLGLSTVNDIVGAWDGGIHIASRRGVGTSMQVHLPVDTRGEDEIVGSGLERGKGEAVLLVERDPDRLQRDEEIIAALGYEPVGFSDPVQALAACRARPQHFRVAIVELDWETHLDLPRMLADIREDLPVLVMADPNALSRDVDLQESRLDDIIAAPLSAYEVAEVLTKRLAA